MGQGLELSSLFRLTLAGLAFILIGYWPLPARAQAPAPVVVRVAPASVQVVAGQTVDVAVEVVDVQDLYGADVALSFDPAVVEVVDADPTLDGIQVGHGLFLDPGFVLFNLADNQVGALRMAITQMNPSLPKSGTGALVVVTLRGKLAGASTPLTLIRAQLARRDGIDIQSVPMSGQVAVVPEAPPGPTNTPIPTQGAGTPIPTRTPLPTAMPTTVMPTATSLPPTDLPLPTDTAFPTPTSVPQAISSPAATLPALLPPSPEATATARPATATSEPAAATALPSTVVPYATAAALTAAPVLVQTANTAVVQMQPETLTDHAVDQESSSARDAARDLVLAGAGVLGLILVAAVSALAFLAIRHRR